MHSIGYPGMQENNVWKQSGQKKERGTWGSNFNEADAWLQVCWVLLQHPWTHCWLWGFPCRGSELQLEASRSPILQPHCLSCVWCGFQALCALLQFSCPLSMSGFFGRCICYCTSQLKLAGFVMFKGLMFLQLRSWSSSILRVRLRLVELRRLSRLDGLGATC